MLPFGITALEFAVVTFVSAFVGMAAIIFASKIVRTRFLAAFAFGVYLWYFTDTLAGANYLNVNGGPVLDFRTVSLVVLFPVGLVTFFALDGSVFASGEESAGHGLLVAVLVALALGLHGAGEGADFGYTAAQTPSTLLLGAFGGLAQGGSWVLHKMLEPTLVAVCYVAFAGAGARSRGDKVTETLTLATVFTLPVIVGSVAGYYATFDHSFIFALGLGASIYAVARVVKPMFSASGPPSRLASLRMAAWAFAGFLLIYLAALLHS